MDDLADALEAAEKESKRLEVHSLYPQFSIVYSLVWYKQVAGACQSLPLS